jgi:hypothetical protein
MQTAAKVLLLQYPPPPVLTPQLITAASAISTRLYAFDLGVFIAKLAEVGVQRYGEPLDPCWLYIVLPNGYKHFAYFSNDVPEAAVHASLYPNHCLGALFTAALGRRAVFRPLGRDYLDGLFETLAQSEEWSIRITNYIEYELYPNQHAVDRRRVAERLRAVLPEEATYKKDAPRSVPASTTLQALLADPKLTKLTALGPMEYREAALVPAQHFASLLGTLF